MDQPSQLQKSKAQYVIQVVIDGDQDPSAVATDGSAGTLFIKTSAAYGLYLKQDDGVTTNWVLTTGGGGGGMQALNVMGTFDAPIMVGPGGQIAVVSTADTLIFVAGAGGPQAAGSPPVTSPNAMLGQRITLMGTSNVDTVSFVQAVPTWVSNGNRVLGIYQSVTMQCIRSALVAAPNGNWAQIYSTP